MVDIDSEKSLQKVVTAFLNAWNVLPHNSLGGKTPIEVAKEAQEAPSTDR